MVKKAVLKVFIAVIVALLLSLSANVIAGQKNFLWKVQSNEGTVYVLGSIHYLKKEAYPLSPKIEDAFNKSDSLVVEADINDAEKIDVSKILANAIYPDNDSLENHVSKETFQMIKREVVALGMPMELVNKQKPWLLAMTLSSLELIRLGYDPNYGIDKYFLSKAKGKKKILELESIDYQIDLFSKFSDKEQEWMLLSTLNDLKTLKDKIDKIVKAWTSGDLNGMEAVLSEGIKEDKMLASFYEKLLYKRNKDMIAKIEGYLKTKDIHFVVVGAGHLVGDRGIIKKLKAKGYQVEQM